jgi:double zinc ribbon protein
MSEIKFSKNFADHSVQSGADAGFQFEFFCERCNDSWRTEFVAYRGGQASSWFGKAAGMFGGVLGQAESAAESLAQAGYGKAHDTAFAAAIEKAKTHFHRCARCLKYACDTCWNNDKGLCRDCAPDAEVEIDAARAEGEVKKARELAELAGEKRAESFDVNRERQHVCPQCHAETHGAKLAVLSECPKCSAKISPGAKFCPECGNKLG